MGFVLYPLLQVFYLSLTSWDGFTSPIYIGLGNFNALFKDSVFYISLTNNLTWVLIFIVLNNGLGLLLAGAIDIMSHRLSRAFRIILYMSVLLPNVVVSYLFLAIYDPNIGIVDTFLKGIGLKTLGQTAWLGNANLALYSILGSSIWQYAAFPMLIFIAAFASISPSLYDAALLDGANHWQIFWRIKVPAIKPVIYTLLALTWIWNSMPFSQIWTMTQGGPGNASQVLVTYMYENAFSGLRLGYAASISVITFLIIVPVVIVLVWVFER